MINFDRIAQEAVAQPIGQAAPYIAAAINSIVPRVDARQYSGEVEAAIARLLVARRESWRFGEIDPTLTLATKEWVDSRFASGGAIVRGEPLTQQGDYSTFVPQSALKRRRTRRLSPKEARDRLVRAGILKEAEVQKLKDDINNIIMQPKTEKKVHSINRRAASGGAVGGLHCAVTVYADTLPLPALIYALLDYFPDNAITLAPATFNFSGKTGDASTLGGALPNTDSIFSLAYVTARQHDLSPLKDHYEFEKIYTRTIPRTLVLNEFIPAIGRNFPEHFSYIGALAPDKQDLIDPTCTSLAKRMAFKLGDQVPADVSEMAHFSQRGILELIVALYARSRVPGAKEAPLVVTVPPDVYTWGVYYGFILPPNLIESENSLGSSSRNEAGLHFVTWEPGPTAGLDDRDAILGFRLTKGPESRRVTGELTRFLQRRVQERVDDWLEANPSGPECDELGEAFLAPLLLFGDQGDLYDGPLVRMPAEAWLPMIARPLEYGSYAPPWRQNLHSNIARQEEAEEMPEAVDQAPIAASL